MKFIPLHDEAPFKTVEVLRLVASQLRRLKHSIAGLH